MIRGKFSDQDSYVATQLAITAATNVKTDLNVQVIENDQVAAKNVFLNTQAIGNNPATTYAQVANVGQTTVGEAQSSGQITSGGQPCAIGQTKIMTPDGFIYLHDIRLENNVIVCSFDPVSGMLAENRVTDFFAHVVPSYTLLEFEDGHTTGIDAEQVHRYWIGHDDYESVANLTRVWHWDDGWVPRSIVNRRLIQEETIVYNITVANHHNYIANGDAVSNSKPPPGGGGLLLD